MTCREIEVGGRTFDFEYHTSGHYGPMHFAVNVKNHCFVDLPQKYQRKLERLDEEESGLEDKLKEWAWQDTSEQWWEGAKDLADELSLGKVYSAGRCGGWLILDDYTFDSLQNLAEEYNRECKHCEQPFESHAKEKCLFDTTTFASESSTLEMFITLEKFAKQISESAKLAHKDYDHNLRFHIDNRWEEYRDEKKRRRLERCTASAVGA